MTTRIHLKKQSVNFSIPKSPLKEYFLKPIDLLKFAPLGLPSPIFSMITFYWKSGLYQYLKR